MEINKNYQLIPSLRYIAMVLLFLALTTRAGMSAILTPNYDVPSEQLKLFDGRIDSPLLLSCNVTADGHHTIIWKKNDTNVKDIKELKGRYQIIDKANQFIIATPEVYDAGKYSCSIPNLEEAEIHVIANVYFKKLPENMAVVEGEKLQIHCKAFGTNPVVTWKIGNNETLDLTRVTLKEDSDHIKDAILVIEHTNLLDRNMYNCTATNQATGHLDYDAAEQGSYVRVKGKLAALWPFLGICAEVFILCAIILVYEKRRNKADLDESDTDQSPEQEKLKTGK